MTVVYTHEVATGGRGFGNFIKLLRKWKGSIYKLVLPDLTMYALMYYIISLVYRFWLSDKDDEDQQKKTFHLLVKYCADVSNFLPLQFILGFYVSQIVSRWWSQFMTIPWPDTIAAIVATCVHGHDDRGTIPLSDYGPHGRGRIIIEHLNEKSEGPKYWVPLIWACSVASKARREGRIKDDVALYHIIKEFTKFRNMAGDLLSYDWVCIPIVYTQVVTLCTYVYFAACLLGKQFLNSRTEDEIDIYVPVFHFMEFFFLMGWLKVAETMVNPFGEDDDDFEVNWLIDRNFRVSYLIVDEMNAEFPEMVKDAYWDEVVPDELPYTEAAMKFKKNVVEGSAGVTEAQAAAADRKMGEGSMIGSSAMSGGVNVQRASGSLGFHPFTYHLPANKDKKGSTTGEDVFDFSQSNRLQKNKDKDKTGEVGTIPAEDEKRSYGHLMDRSYVPRRKDSFEDVDKQGS